MTATELAHLRRATLIVGAPALLAIVEALHPHPHDVFEHASTTWLAVHYAQIPLFALAASALVDLVRDRSGIAAVVARLSAFVFAVSYVAFDTAAGVVTGILAAAALRSGDAQAWRSAIETVWKDPVVGGAPSASVPLLAVLGAVALSVATVAASITLRRGGSSLLPVVLLAVSGFGISIFGTHAWPGGPLTFGTMAIAAAWLLRDRMRRDRAGARTD